MKIEKEYVIIQTIIGNKTRTKEWKGTIQELIKSFNYTLSIGNSYNKKINCSPKTIKSLISSLNKSKEIIEASCYTRTYYELKV